MPEILTGHAMFTRALRRNGSALDVFAMLDLSTCFTRWASEIAT
jgi:hypothetical protein